MIGKPAFENLSLGPIRSVLSTFWMDVEELQSRWFSKVHLFGHRYSSQDVALVYLNPN